MNTSLHLRAFLSRQKDAGYCIACLTVHGAFGNTDLVVRHVAIAAVQIYPNALAATFADCASCGIRSLCLLFPGKILDAGENRWSLMLLTSEYLPRAA